MTDNTDRFVTIRDACAGDWPRLWPIVRDIAAAQTTFAYDPNLTEDEGRTLWMLPPPARVTVAMADDRTVGTAAMYPNRPGPGDHVASGSIMVDRDARGMGVGRALTTDLIAWARRSGYDAIQFNAVVDTNTSAIRLYEDLGFVTIGTVPAAFRHATEGHVGLRIMWLDLRSA